ncbi:MAG: 4Fe-4S dicluster domain-containing protein [Candidatus Pacearchaeota archaeon]
MGVSLEINVERCKGCGLCVSHCLNNILEMGNDTNQNSYNYPQLIEPEQCVGCRNCYTICPDVCFKIVKT